MHEDKDRDEESKLEFDHELVIDILDNMLWAIDQIHKRFREIDNPALSKSKAL